MSLLLVKKLIAHSFALLEGVGAKKSTARAFSFDQHEWMLGINAFGRFLNVNLNSSAYKKRIAGSAHLFIIILTIFYYNIFGLALHMTKTSFNCITLR